MNSFTYTVMTCKMLSNTNRENILKKLENKDGLRFENIKSALKLNSNTLSYHVKKLLGSKMIYKNQNKYYITGFGRNALEFIRGLNAIVEKKIEENEI